MKHAIIVAMADHRVIGRGGELPWHLPADLRRFRRLTMGHHLIVGRKTWESIGRPLEGRRMVVVSSRAPELPSGVTGAGSLEEALELARRNGEEEAFVGGGAEIYRQSLPLAERIYLTRVHAAIPGDTHFPEWRQEDWRVLSREPHPADDRHPHPFTFLVLERRESRPPSPGESDR